MSNQLSRVFRPLLRGVRDLAPIVAVIVFFQLVGAQEPVEAIGEKLIGLLLVLFGLTLFLAGLSMSLFPLGERLAEEFAARANIWLLLAFAFAIGFGSTIAEPALIAVTDQAAVALAGDGGAPDGGVGLLLRLAASAAVGLSVVLTCLRILLGWPAFVPVIAAYGVILALVTILPSSLDGIAFDAGAAATSAINIPLIAALGIGLATVLEGRSPIADGFGAVALASAMPMLTILIGGALLR